MKKLLILTLFLLIMTTSSFAFSLDVISGETIGFNTPPTVNLDSPTDTAVYPTNTPLIKWTYHDADGDTQRAYLIEIDTDYQFSNPILIGGTDATTSKKVRLTRGEGMYYARVKVMDDYSWSKLSNVRGFYIDLSEKACSDGTKFWECSTNPPFYCDGSTLTEDCTRCGCSVNALCEPSGKCLTLTCRDGTRYGECSKGQPYYCQAGNPIEICSLCGCPKGQTCQSDGSCTAIIVVKAEEKPETVSPLSILERIALFFKGFLSS